MQLDIISLEMGYGHLRAAYPIADALGCPLYLADEPPIADERESRLWKWIRQGHSFLSRPSESEWLARKANDLMDLVTIIFPMYEKEDQSKPDFATKFIHQFINRGLGRGLVEHLHHEKSALLTTIYAPAVIANAAGIERIYCVVTDADVQRVWVPYDPAQSRIHYFAPSTRVARRLQAYGIREDHITLTGFPLPYELTNQQSRDALRRHVARRIVKLDPEGTFRKLHAPMLSRLLGDLPEPSTDPIMLTLAIGGAGAQASIVDDLLPRLKDRIRSERVVLNLVAGTRVEVAQRFGRHGEHRSGVVGIRISIESRPAQYASVADWYSLTHGSFIWNSTLTRPSLFGALPHGPPEEPPLSFCTTQTMKRRARLWRS